MTFFSKTSFKQVKDKDQIKADCERAVKEKQDELERCREKANDMRIMDDARLMDSMSPEHREVSNFS